MSSADDSRAKRVVRTGAELGPYSSAVVAGEHCYVAGMGGFVPGTRQLVDGGFDAEIKLTLDNLAATLDRAGFRLEDVVSATCYLRDLSNWARFNELYRGYFGDELPARAAVGVDDLPGGANVEVSCIAWRPGGPA
jgi:2-iminobutanoate/2-iminopropanoate deaminase